MGSPLTGGVVEDGRRGRTGGKGYRVIGIDPGPAYSAVAEITEAYEIRDAQKLKNDECIEWIRQAMSLGDDSRAILPLPALSPVVAVAIEGLRCYGRIVGAEVFETAYMVGRVMQVCEDHGSRCMRYWRQEYGFPLTGSTKVSDSAIRNSLMMRFGGYKKNQPLYRIRSGSDLRTAFALAVYQADWYRLEQKIVQPTQSGRRSLVR